MTEVTDEILQEMVNVIVDAINPEQIVLFGSQVHGDISPDSDLDLLIIDSSSFDAERPRRTVLGDLWRSLARFRFPLDLLLFTREEVEKWRGSGGHIIGTALREGKVIYERG